MAPANVDSPETASGTRGTGDPLPQIEITTAKWDGDYKVMAYLVPGTDEVFAVHPSLSHINRWTVTHTPTRRALRANLASREEAEDLACWVWCNCLDREGLKSSDIVVAVDAAGARARSRFSRGNVFSGGRRNKGKGGIGTAATEIPPAERFLARRIREIERLRSRWYADHRTRSLALEEERGRVTADTAQLTTRQAAFSADCAQKTADLTRGREELTGRADAIIERERACAEVERAVAVIRNQLAAAIHTVAECGGVDGEFKDSAAMRELRGIRIKGQSDLV